MGLQVALYSGNVYHTPVLELRCSKLTVNHRITGRKRVLLDVCNSCELASFFNISTTRNYIARLCPTAAPPSCTAVRITKEPWLALQMSSNLRPLRAQKTAECIVLCLAHVESLPKGPHNKQFPVETTSRRIETCES